MGAAWGQYSGHIRFGVPRSLAIHETTLYAPDPELAASFYVRVLGVVPIPASLGSAGRALRLPSGSVLLIFDPARSVLPGRGVPIHGAIGPGHVAFGVDALDPWRGVLSGAGVPIEQEIDWPGGARSIYFRDPAGNSVELMEGDYWAWAQRHRPGT